MKMAKPIVEHASFVLFLLCAVSAFAARPEKVLLSFDFTNGDYPQGLSMDPSANLWAVQSFGGSGTCPEYGTDGCGTVVELAPGSGGWKPKIVYSFRGGSDGNRPTGNLVFDAYGNIYGVTVGGGSPTCQCGTVYKLTPASGGWKESVIYRFNKTKNHNDGMAPWAGLIMDAAGNLYGTTEGGGNACIQSCGTVFELSPSANGAWTETILYNFKGTGFNDGQNPTAPLAFDAQGNLYGTTYWGGAATYGQCSSGGGGCGVVFELSPNGSGGWTESVIHIFSSGNGDGFYPFAGLMVDPSGNLYGTTTSGGFFTSCDNSFYCGTVFELSPAPGGAWTETLLHSFSGTEGSSPQSALTVDATGNLYGTTYVGGVYNGGTAFELSPSGGGWKQTVLHSFGNGNDGVAPEAALVLDASGNLFSSTPYGGADVTGSCASFGCGTVFEIMP
jgi:uncharacterized repeat protein (TIGR03803 family)